MSSAAWTADCMYSDAARRRKRDEDEEMAEYIHRQTDIFRALRWITLIMLLAMAFLSLIIFTHHVEERSASSAATAMMEAMGSLLLAGLGVFSVYRVKVGYLATFCVLLLILNAAIYSTQFFQKHLLNSVMLHVPHFAVLFCSWAFMFTILCPCI